MSAAPGRPKQARTAAAGEGTPVSLARPPEEARTAAAGEGTPVNAALIVEEGAMGRVAYARVDACLVDAHGNQRRVHGPAVEIVSLAGEVRLLDDGSLNAALTGVVADTAGSVHGGLFVAGSNTVCMTLEVTLEEWLPASATSS